MNIKRNNNEYSHSRFRFCNPIYLFLLLLTIGIASCDESATFVGIDLLPEKDRLHTAVYDTTTIVAYIGTIDSTQAFNLQTGLLGSYMDPIVGSTDAALALQFSPTTRNNLGSEPKADSIFLILRYDTLYGNPGTPLSIRAYMLTENIKVNTVYYTNQDMTGMYGPDEVTADDLPLITSEGDSLLKISLDPVQIGDLILSADSVNQLDTLFHLIFNGLYITADPVLASGEGSILKINFGSVYTRIELFYHNADADSLKMILYSGPNDAAFNTVKHDYSGTSFNDQLNDSTQPVTTGYVQAGNGLFTRLTFPYFSAWKDSFPAAIHQVQLTVPVEEENAAFYPASSYLYLNARTDTGSFYVLPDEYYFINTTGGSSYVGGSYNQDKMTYTFNVTELMQQYLLGKIKNNDIYLRLRTTVTNPSTERIVVKNSDIHMKVIFSKQ
jgi:hypothetical protein